MFSRICLPHVLNGRDEQLGTWDDALFTYDTVIMNLKTTVTKNVPVSCIYISEKQNWLYRKTYIDFYMSQRDKVKCT